ncbi:rhamnan synthesis F family protein [Microbacterium sp.]|uniref:rhamnan synthesis F family protein n=1 Tax=Microbacterium sp. TaxID=51671 RepID=UPI0039E431BB
MTSSPTSIARPRRAVLYALSGDSRRVEDFVTHALDAVRAHATHLVVIVGRGFEGATAELEDHADQVYFTSGAQFDPAAYFDAFESLGAVVDDVDEIVLTGDAWFGPINELAPVLERMDAVPGALWQIVENRSTDLHDFPMQSHPAPVVPWTWTTIRRELFESAAWREYWGVRRSRHEHLVQERTFVEEMRSRGLVASYAWPVDGYPVDDPALHIPDVLLKEGYPFLSRVLFGIYPPELDRHAIVGRRIIAGLRDFDYPVELVYRALARTVPPRTLNANAGLLDVLPKYATAEDDIDGSTIAAVVHVTDLGAAGILRDHLANLPEGFHLYITTTDGRKAATLERFFEDADLGAGRVEIRVTPAGAGRDMSALFVGCVDVLHDDRYELVFKVHGRGLGKKTLSIARYFRSYQLGNLLESAGYVRNLISLFRAEPGLGVVYPPMMHIGYATMGSGWAVYHAAACRLLKRLGIDVAVDPVSPLAPYGGMWVFRPAALAPMTAEHWRYKHYSGGVISRERDLGRVQERLISYAAGEAGYHTRTVLTTEHAAISHTALDFKVDQLFSTTTGYPVEQITLIQRAGRISGGGPLGLLRMYININHPRVARALVPVYRIALSGHHTFAGLRVAARRALRRARRESKGVG